MLVGTWETDTSLCYTPLLGFHAYIFFKDLSKMAKVDEPKLITDF